MTNDPFGGRRASVDDHLDSSQELLEADRDALAHGLLVVACETYWGAVVHLLQAVALFMGESHRNHRDLFRVLNILEHKSGISGMMEHVRLIYNLHLNFYRVVLTESEIREIASLAEAALEDIERSARSVGAID